MAWYTSGGNVVIGPIGAIMDSGSGGVIPPPPVPPLANDLFPRTSWQVIAPGGGSGTSYAYANATFQANAAKFNIVNPGSYAGIEQTMGNTTFATIFNNIKNLSIANGFPTPTRCILYVMSSEQSTVGGGGNASSYTVWSNMIQNANWWIRNTNTGSGAGWPNGAIVTNDTNSGDFATISGNAVLDSGGRTFGQGFWFHYDGLLRQGNGVALGYASNLSFAANANLDGYQMDNVFCTPRQSGSWNMDTTIYASGNATAAAFLQQGQALQVAALKAINPNLIVMGNCDYFGHATSTFSTLVTLDPSQNGLFDMVYCQSAIGGPNGIEGQGVTTTAQFMTNMIAAEAQMASTGTLIFEQCGPSHGATFSNTSQASWTNADWQSCRFGAAMCFMRNWHYELNYNENYSPTAPYFIDEVLAQSGAYGWLGNPIDSPQSAARTSGVWWRQFQNGVVFMNPKGNGSQTLNLASLGLSSNLSAIANVGFGDAAINTGLAVSSITLADRDGRFLIGLPGFVHQQAFTVTGSGFGTKSRGLAPLLDDHGQAGIVTTGTGNIDSQWTGGRTPPGSSPTFDFYPMRNRNTGGFAPTGYTVGAPHSFVQAIIGGSHYNDGVNGGAGWELWVSLRVTLPTLPCVIYARWYERQDPNSYIGLEPHGNPDGPQINNKCGSWAPVPGTPSTTMQIMQLVVGGPSNNVQTTWQMGMSDNHSCTESPDRNGHVIAASWGECPNPYNPANGWVLKEWELCIDQTTGPSGVGYNKYSGCTNGTVYPILGNVGTVQTPGTHGAGDGYAGRTDNFTGTSRAISIGNGNYLNDYGNLSPGTGGQPDFPQNTYNWCYLADARIDMTAGSVQGNVARVIIGDQPTLAASAIRAYCDVSAWSNTSITATAWKDQFVTGQTGYVHVVTESSGVLDNQFSGVWA